MRYVVLTPRHHDGYGLFETATHDFHADTTAPDRNPIAEYVETCCAAGLRVGFSGLGQNRVTHEGRSL